MTRYEENYGTPTGGMRQKDLVLAVNEYTFVQDKTSGAIRTYTGPTMLTISQQQALVTFDPNTKKFNEINDFEKAKHLFVSAPEGWYIVLKNPSSDNSHPVAGNVSGNTSLEIGKKVNVAGPCSFSLYPGQMAKAIRGHRLRSNQYLLARVYDADAAEKGMATATIVDADGKEIQNKSEKYFVGQLLVIKGTEVSFYIPPTGIEVLAIGKENGRGSEKDQYVRDAVTLERLEYVILKDENGEKRYVSGPAVVFPKPTETFVEASSKKGSVVFRALELSPISGIYVKVIADYKDEDGTEHKTGEELFITGNDTMVYYPRPEHALIQYDGKYMHHAIAIPEGEGRYVLNRLNGKIKTVKGPAMYLPDPRTEVVVKRKLTPKECELFYPGNKEVLNYNNALSEQASEKLARLGRANAATDAINCAYSTANTEKSLAIFEATSNISRGVSYTKPRTITLDTKFDGVVSIDVWSGYAISVISKTGNRETIVGPATRLLDYDETLEAFEVPTEDDSTATTSFLKIENNKVLTRITAQTSDYVGVQMVVEYSVNFLEKNKNKWFTEKNYASYLKDTLESLIKVEVKKYDIQSFYDKAQSIIMDVVLDRTDKNKSGRLFEKNGMLITDVNIVSVSVEREYADMLEKHQADLISKSIELKDAAAKLEVTTKLAETQQKEIELKYQTNMRRLKLTQEEDELRFAIEEAEKKAKREAVMAAKQAESDMQVLLDEIQNAELEREKAMNAATIELEEKKAAIEKAKQESYAATIEKIMKSIQPGLIEALQGQTNAELATGLGQAVAPYAVAKGESIADAVSKMVRGTTMESLIKDMKLDK